MFYNIKIFEKVWSERKKGVTLHSLSGTKRRSGGADPGLEKEVLEPTLKTFKNLRKNLQGSKKGFNFASAFGQESGRLLKTEHIERITIDIKSSTREQKCTRSILDPISVINYRPGNEGCP